MCEILILVWIGYLLCGYGEYAPNLCDDHSRLRPPSVPDGKSTKTTLKTLKLVFKNMIFLLLLATVFCFTDILKEEIASWSFRLVHYYYFLIVCLWSFSFDFTTIPDEDHLPSDYFPKYSLLRYITFSNYYLNLFTKYCLVPCYAAWLFLLPTVSKPRLRWYISSFFRTPSPFNCDDFEEASEDLVCKVKLHRKYILGRCGYERNVKIILSKNIYYKRIDSSKLTKTEMEYWPELKHESILSLYKFQATSLDPFFVVQEIKWRNGLDDILYNDDFNNRDDFFHYAVKWSHDILMGLQYLHSKNLYHLDLEPENIMLEFGGRYDALNSKAIIANFRNMAKLEEGTKEVYGDVIGFSEYYRPPECFMKSKVDAEKCDMWGLGIIILEMFSGGLLALWQDQYPEFNHRRRDNHLDKLLVLTNFFAAIDSAHDGFDFQPFDSEDIPADAHDSTSLSMTSFWQIWVFLTDLLKLDSYTRISLENSLQHGFMKNVCNVVLNQGTEFTQTGDFKKKVEEFAEKVEKAGDEELQK